MRILGIYAEDYPWDIRIQKIFGGLSARGHEVLLLCRNLKRRKTCETVDGINCRRVLSRTLPGFIQRSLSVPGFINPLWTYAIRRELKYRRYDLVIVRDLPLAPGAIFEAQRAERPCIVDMAENHPEMWREVNKHDNMKFKNFVLKNPYFAKEIEKWVVKNASGIVVVVEEMQQHICKVGSKKNSTCIVSNTPERLPNIEIKKSLYKDSLNITYIGFITSRRGLNTVIKALALLKNFSPKPVLHIIGDGSHVQQLKKLAYNFGVIERIKWYGWVEHSFINNLLRKSDVGIIPHPKNGHTDYTVPNKLFDYMANALPVIVSNAKPLERIVRENNCGFVFQHDNPLELVEVIKKMSDCEVRNGLGNKGRKAVINQYNWENDFNKFLDFVLKIKYRTDYKLNLA